MFRVAFTNKQGARESRSFPSRILAESYARSVRNPTIEETIGEASEVSVKVCPVGTMEAQRAASRAFYLQTKAGNLYNPNAASEARAQQAEQEAERMAEHFNEYRVSGLSMEDAWKDWDG